MNGSEPGITSRDSTTAFSLYEVQELENGVWADGSHVELYDAALAVVCQEAQKKLESVSIGLAGVVAKASGVGDIFCKERP